MPTPACSAISRTGASTARGCEHYLCRIQQRIKVALHVGTYPPIRALMSFQFRCCYVPACGSPFECRPQMLIEVLRQSAVGRIARVQRRSESLLGAEELHIPLHPERQRLSGLVRGRKNRCLVGTGVHLTLKDCCDEVGAL